MKYDRDLRISRAMLGGLALANIGAGVWCAFLHSWVETFAAVLWVANCAFMVRSFRLHQQTRDDCEKSNAEWHKLMVASLDRETEAVRVLTAELAEAGAADPPALSIEDQEKRRGERMKHWFN